MLNFFNKKQISNRIDQKNITAKRKPTYLKLESTVIHIWYWTEDCGNWSRSIKET